MIRLNRRGFLKYAGAGAAVVGASALGLNYVSQNPSRTTQTASTLSRLSTTTISSTSSAQSVQLASLQGRLFFDYNGNGKQDGEEPAVDGVLVQLKDGTGNVVAQTLTDSSGDYKLDDVATGSYTLHVDADKKFQYMCDSPYGFSSLQKGWYVPLRQDTTQDLGLMQGFLTLPIAPNTTYKVGRYYDWDPKIGHVKWWNGKEFDWSNPAHGAWNDSHTGTDFDTSEGQLVIAPAPGRVIFAGIGLTPESLEIDIEHDLKFMSACHHLSKILVSVGERVSRGQTIGKVGKTGTYYPHLHLDLYQTSPIIMTFDPYRPTFIVPEDQSGCWAVKDGQKYWCHLPVADNPNLLNFWTEDNDPQYPSNPQGQVSG